MSRNGLACRLNVNVSSKRLNTGKVNNKNLLYNQIFIYCIILPNISWKIWWKFVPTCYTIASPQPAICNSLLLISKPWRCYENTDSVNTTRLCQAHSVYSNRTFMSIPPSPYTAYSNTDHFEIANENSKLPCHLTGITPHTSSTDRTEGIKIELVRIVLDQDYYWRTSPLKA